MHTKLFRINGNRQGRADSRPRRHALPIPYTATRLLDRELVSPRTPAEEVVAKLWRFILRLESVSIYDNFIEQGGDSLLATQMTLMLRDIFQVHLSVRRFLQEPTIDELVKNISRSWGGREIVEEIAWTFLQLEELSEAEVKSMLAEQLSNKRIK
jgi:acyl carrier protein